METKVAETFAERARHRLAALGWTHEDLARHLEIQRGTVSKYLQGKTVPGADLILKWADELGVSPNWLLGHEEEVSEEALRVACVAAILKASPVQLTVFRDAFPGLFETAHERKRRPAG